MTTNEVVMLFVGAVLATLFIAIAFDPFSSGFDDGAAAVCLAVGGVGYTQQGGLGFACVCPTHLNELRYAFTVPAQTPDTVVWAGVC